MTTTSKLPEIFAIDSRSAAAQRLQADFDPEGDLDEDGDIEEPPFSDFEFDRTE